MNPFTLTRSARSISRRVYRQLTQAPALLLIFGGPGAGKGHLGNAVSRCLRAHGVRPHLFDMGDVLRRYPERFQAYTSKGIPVPKDLLWGIVREEMHATPIRVQVPIIIGLPRYECQEPLVTELFRAHGYGGHHAMLVNCSEELCIASSQKRAVEEGRVEDSSPDKVARRFKDYEEKTLPVARRWMSSALHAHEVNRADYDDDKDAQFRVVTDVAGKLLDRFRKQLNPEIARFAIFGHQESDSCATSEPQSVLAPAA